MESKNIYEISRDEIVKIRKNLSSDSVTINLSKLDSNTKEQLITAITDVTSKRLKDIDKVVLGVQ